MIIINKESLISGYIQNIQQNFLPFWEKAIDREYGGIFTCFTNDGGKLISDRKYIWSQGRFLWLCSQLQRLKDEGLLSLSEIWNESREKTYQFLKNHAQMANQHIVYALERNGERIKDQLDISIFADCFYVLGCNAYAQYEEDVNAFEHALRIYQTIKERIEKNNFKSEPYPIPFGYRSHSIPMILLNVVQELHETAKKFNHFYQKNLKKDEEQCLLEIIQVFSSVSRISEMKSNDPKQKNSLLSRHVNPGHTLESIWFMIHSLKHFNLEKNEQYIRHLAHLAARALSLGWDKEFGGILRFVDKDGGIPQGEKIGTPYESLITETWDMKLWWPHSEALYTTLLLYEKTKDHKWLDWYEEIENYTFQTFPNPNKAIGEWIQIRNRRGEPLEKVVALPVKDPFHIIRNFILIIRLLERKN